MKYYRKGAIRFLKLGRFGFSWWWAKSKPRTNLGPEHMYGGYNESSA